MKTKFIFFCLVLSAIIFTPAVSANNSDLGKYSWEGVWESNWGEMVITQNGASVTGTYTHDNGRINGTVSGSTFTGTWSESPSYAPDNDAGDMELVMSADGMSFTGKWRYGSGGSWGNWEGAKRTTPLKLAPVADKKPEYKDSGIRASDLYGEVLIRRCDNEDSWELLELDTVIYEGDVIKTASNSGAILSMLDMTTFEVKSEAEIIITVPSGKDSKLKLVMGNIYTNFKKMATHGTMEIEMSQAVAGIKGTTLVCEETGTKSTLKVLEGTVTLVSKKSGKSTEVTAGNMAVVDASGNISKIPLNIAAETKKWDKTILELQINNKLMRVNGAQKEIDPGKDTVPTIINGRTLIPIRAVFEALGGTVSYDGNEQRITLKKDDKNLQMWIGKTSMNINGSPKNMDVAPLILKGRTMVPLRFVAENFGYSVQWKATERKIIIQ